MIKVVLANEDVVVLDDLRSIFNTQSDIEIVSEATSTVDMLQLIAHDQPDVVVMDAVLPDADVLDVIRQIQARPEPPRIVISSTFGDTEKARDIFSAGVRGYCLRSDDSRLVPAAVWSVAQGLRCASPTLCERLLEFAPATPDLSVIEKFTQREKDVLKLLAKGPTRKELASALGIADSTVRDHLDSISEKTGLVTREQMIAYAAKHRFDLL